MVLRTGHRWQSVVTKLHCSSQNLRCNFVKMTGECQGMLAWCLCSKEPLSPKKMTQAESEATASETWTLNLAAPTQPQVCPRASHIPPSHFQEPESEMGSWTETLSLIKKVGFGFVANLDTFACSYAWTPCKISVRLALDLRPWNKHSILIMHFIWLS